MTAPASNAAVDFTLFIPCLNEAPRVEGTLETVRLAMEQLGRSYEALVVDDGSTDDTAAVVERYARAHPDMPVRLHRNGRNEGVAYSFVEAAFMGRGLFFRLVWGDDVEPRETLVRILSLAGRADLVIPYYPHVPGKGAARMGLSRLYTGLVNVLSGFRLHYYNGSVLCRRYDAMRWSPHNHGFTGFLADLITQLLAEGATYMEIPVEGRHITKAGKATPLSVRNFISTGLTLQAILQRRFSYWLFRKQRGRPRAVALPRPPAPATEAGEAQPS